MNAKIIGLLGLLSIGAAYAGSATTTKAVSAKTVTKADKKAVVVAKADDKKGGEAPAAADTADGGTKVAPKKGTAKGK